MFVLETIVLFMETDDVFELDWCSLGVCAVAIEVFDVTETVTSKRELVCCDSESNISDVECLLAVVGSAWV